MLYVADSAAIIEVQNSRPNSSACFNGMTALVEESSLCFPDEVIEELGRLAKDEAGHVWARAVSGSRCHRGAPFNYVTWVLQECSGLVDATALASQEPAAVYVAAQALQLSNDGKEVAVVTEDVHEKPTRQCLAEACERLELSHTDLDGFLSQANIPSV